MSAIRVEGCDSCDFLGIQDPPGRIVTTDFHSLTLAPDQLYLGRAYLTLGRHASRVSDLRPEEALDMYDVIRRYELAMGEVYGATCVTVATLMNNAYQEQFPLPHVHSHLRPRYAQPANVGGAIFEDPNFGHHHLRDRTRTVAPDFLKEIAEPLRTLMSI